MAVQNHDRASPRFTAKLLFRDWQPVNDSMLEQIWPLLSLYVRVPTGCLWSVWYTTSNRISRRTDFCHRENRHCTWFPDRNDVSVDFWIERGWAVATATMKTGIDENDIANRHCCKQSVVTSVSPESCFDSISTCRLEYFLREGVVDVTRFCRCKWKVSIQFFGTEQNWDRFEYSYRKVRESTRGLLRNCSTILYENGNAQWHTNNCSETFLWICMKLLEISLALYLNKRIRIALYCVWNSRKSYINSAATF